MAARKNPGIVLFDGTCAFCEGSVKFIARRDPAGHFRFGASQSPQAAGLLTTYGLTRETARSLILIEEGRVYLRSTAALRIASRMTFPWTPTTTSRDFCSSRSASTASSPPSAIVSPARRTPARYRRRRFGPG